MDLILFLVMLSTFSFRFRTAAAAQVVQPDSWPPAYRAKFMGRLLSNMEHKKGVTVDIREHKKDSKAL